MRRLDVIAGVPPWITLMTPLQSVPMVAPPSATPCPTARYAKAAARCSAACGVCGNGASTGMSTREPTVPLGTLVITAAAARRSSLMACVVHEPSTYKQPQISRGLTTSRPSNVHRSPCANPPVESPSYQCAVGLSLGWGMMSPGWGMSAVVNMSSPWPTVLASSRSHAGAVASLAATASGCLHAHMRW